MTAHLQKTSGELAQAYEKRLIDNATKPLVDIIKELYEHLNYIGWGDSYEREGVIAPGGLADRTEALLKKEGLL